MDNITDGVMEKHGCFLVKPCVYFREMVEACKKTNTALELTVVDLYYWGSVSAVNALLLQLQPLVAKPYHVVYRTEEGVRIPGGERQIVIFKPAEVKRVPITGHKYVSFIVPEDRFSDAHNAAGQLQDVTGVMVARLLEELKDPHAAARSFEAVEVTGRIIFQALFENYREYLVRELLIKIYPDMKVQAYERGAVLETQGQ